MNGSDDFERIVTSLDPRQLAPIATIRLDALDGEDARLKGAQPVALALSPDEQLLFVAEAGLNAIAVVDLTGPVPRLLGQIPVGWWPSGVRVAPDGHTLGEHDAARAEGLL